jgi:hypothetical protein
MQINRRWAGLNRTKWIPQFVAQFTAKQNAAVMKTSSPSMPNVLAVLVARTQQQFAALFPGKSEP